MLRCVECAAESENGLSWRAYLVGVGDEVDPDEEVVTNCPDCDGREFGD
jgi:hypothetical protein